MIFPFYRPDSKITVQFICLTVFFQKQFHIVKMRIFWCPKLCVRQKERQGNGFSFRPHRLFLNYLFSIKNLTLEFCALSIHKLQRGKYPLLKSICLYLKSADIRFRHKFQPDTLPDSRCSGIKTSMRFIMSALFSTAIVTVSAVILRIDNQHILPFCYQLRDIHAKRTVATLMNPCFFLIDPHPAQMIYCSKMQQYSSPDFFFRYLKSSSVPDSRYKICKSDS